MTPPYDNAMPDGTSRLSKDVEDAYDRVMGPPVDEVDEAIATLRRAKDILQNGRLMAACRERQAENAKAVRAKPSGKENGNG